MQKIYKKYFLQIILITFLLGGTFALFLFERCAQAQNRTLYWGSTGRDVVRVQYRLSQWGYYNGPVDGVYGAKTWEAVKLFQARNGLNPDGIVGDSTWAHLGFTKINKGAAATAATSSRAGVWDRNGVYLLAKVIAGEARGEPFLGKVAVGAVILNRVQSSAFPDTLAGVIYQPFAFESVVNGQYNRRVDAESLKAARLAMSGWDPTNGALFFWNPAKRVSPWIWSRNITMRIGKHVFGI